MYEIIPYRKDLDLRIDHFVNQESVNGTFLHSRAFLNYHPEDRFKDASFILFSSGSTAAYFPGIVTGDGTFVSHGGSTFGGPVISKVCYKGSRIFDVLKEADDYLTRRYKHIVLKITPALFAEESPDLLEYALEHLGYQRHTELSSQTELSENESPVENCSRKERSLWRATQKAMEALPEADRWEYRPFKDSSELETFYKFLVISKAKHQTKPVHSLEELLDLQRRLPQNLRFRSLWYKGRYVSGLMQFIFPKTKVVHYQYIAPDENFREFHPTTPLYMSALNEAAQEGFKHVSWGISTEDHGNFLNKTLLHYKESFGAKAVVNATYTK